MAAGDGAESSSLPYVESLSAPKTMLADFVQQPARISESGEFVGQRQAEQTAKEVFVSR